METPTNREIYGEAFNAAESFCKEKMRQALIKLIDRNLDKKATTAIIFTNAEVKDTLEKYKNEKEKKSKMLIHKIYCKTKLNN